MRHFSCLLIGITFAGSTLFWVPGGVLTRAGEKREKPSAEQDLKVLQGTWVCVLAENDGKRLDKDALKETNRTLTIKDNKLTMKLLSKNKEVTFQGSIDLDPSKEPRHFDFMGKGQGGGIMLLSGIYDVKGDEFKLCYVNTFGTAKRPDSFTSAAGSKRDYYVFKRAKN